MLIGNLLENRRCPWLVHSLLKTLTILRPQLQISKSSTFFLESKKSWRLKIKYLDKIKTIKITHKFI